MRNIQRVSRAGGIVPESAAGAQQAPADVDYKGKLLRLIPSEVVAAYVFIEGVLGGNVTDPALMGVVHWVTFGVLLVITPLYLYRVMEVTNRAQLVVSTIGFAVWVFALGGPFLSLADAAQIRVLGAVVLALYTLVVPIFVKPIEA